MAERLRHLTAEAQEAQREAVGDPKVCETMGSVMIMITDITLIT